MTGSLPAGRLAGVDYGRRRIGVAVCDAERIICSPLCVHLTVGDRDADTAFFRRLAAEEAIAGFVVALGLLVDDSIVAVENISRHVRLGYDRTRAAILGTRQIMLAVLGCTATLIFAFLPLMALPGTAGKFIRVLPTAVVATVVGSLLIALFIIPFLASRMLRDEDVGHSNRLLQRIMDAIHRYYRPALHY